VQKDPGAADRLFDAVLALPSTAIAENFSLPESDRAGDFQTSAADRRDRLRVHLDSVGGGDLIIVGEARQSGVPFTSAKAVGLVGSSEASATIVHGMLTTLGIADRTMLWNAFPLHPHAPGAPRTNRTPTTAELATGITTLRLPVAGRRIICVGGPARRSVSALLGIEVPAIDDAPTSAAAVAIRHPANGGAPEFRGGLAAAVSLWNL